MLIAAGFTVRPSDHHPAVVRAVVAQEWVPRVLQQRKDKTSVPSASDKSNAAMLMDAIRKRQEQRGE